MWFHSPNFLVFFVLLLIPFYLFKNKRIALLAAADVLFYAASGFGMLLLFLLMSVVNYAIIRAMKYEKWRWMFWLGIGINVFNLAFFKYSVFLLNSLEAATGFDIGFKETLAAQIVLPVGISFYTFEFISYLIDVRRGITEPTRSFLSYWVYVSLFPHLIAGPIMRGDELFPQLDALKDKNIRWPEVKYGLYIFAIGLIKKIAFADQLAPIANSLFAEAETLTPVQSWIAAYAFCFQIYFDFSAYSDMAIGLGYILGIKLVQNFDSPYISSNPSEFWRRWHITLSRWIRDYIYIGLGGNRRGPVRTQFNLLAAMLISGLWHGAMWTFVLWGGIHGMLLILHKWSLALNRWSWIARLRKSVPYRIAAVAVFFHVITWTWVFFRAQSLEEAFGLSRKMLHADWLSLLRAPEMIWVAALFVLHLFEYVIRRYEAQSSKIWHFVPFPVRSCAYVAIALVLTYLVKGATYEFIYFQF